MSDYNPFVEHEPGYQPSTVNQVAEAKEAESHVSDASDDRGIAYDALNEGDRGAAQAHAMLAVSHELAALRHTLLQLFDSRS